MRPGRAEGKADVSDTVELPSIGLSPRQANPDELAIAVRADCLGADVADVEPGRFVHELEGV